MTLLTQRVVYSTKILPNTSTKSDRTIGKSRIARFVMIWIMRKCGHHAFSNEPINRSPYSSAFSLKMTEEWMKNSKPLLPAVCVAGIFTN